MQDGAMKSRSGIVADEAATSRLRSGAKLWRAIATDPAPGKRNGIVQVSKEKAR
jgi:hypothetical protein